MNKLIIHTGHYCGYYYFTNQIIKEIKQGRDEYIALLPVNRAVRIFKKQLVDAAVGSAVFDPPVFTFDRLLLDIYAKLPKARSLIGHDIFYMLTEKALNEGAQNLKYLGSRGRVTQSLVKKTAEVLQELRRFGYNGEAFSKTHHDDKIRNPLKYHDFEFLLHQIDVMLGEELIDEPYAVYSAAQQLSKSVFEGLYPGKKIIYISGYGLFSPAMYHFIQKTSQWIQVKIKLDYLSSNPSLFNHTAQVLERMKKMGARVIEEPETDILAPVLFKRTENTAKNSALNERIEIQRYDERKDELEAIAARVKKLHLRGKIPLERIALTFSNMEKYGPLVRRAFKAYGIPLNLSTGYTLSQSPLIRLFLNLLNLIISGFDFRKTLHVLNSSFISKPEIFNSDTLLRILVEYRIKNLRCGWHSALKKTLIKRNDQSPALPQKLTQIDNLDNILGCLYEMPRQLSPGEFRSAFIKMLNSLDILNWHKQETPLLARHEQEMEFRAFNRFMKWFDKFIWTTDYFYGSQKLPLAEYYSQLRSGIQNTVFNLTEWPGYGVQVMPRLEILALDYDVLFVGGLIDGEFPRASSRDVFFNDKVRAEMGLLAAEEMLDQDRFIFYQILNSAKIKTILTFPAYEATRALVPSTFLSDLQEVSEENLTVDTSDEAHPNINKLWNDSGITIQNTQFDSSADLLKKIIDIGPKEKNTILSILRRIEAAAGRVYFTEPGVYEGNLKSQKPIYTELQKRYSGKIWSASRLEEYAFCPMQFFISHLLKIEDIPELEETLSPLERGNALHKILYRFYSEINDKEQPLRYRDRLFEITREEFDKLPYDGLFWQIELRRYFGGQGIPGLLDTFLEYDQQRINETGFIPFRFELSFGYSRRCLKDKYSQKEALELGKDSRKLKIAGSIDRIDRNEQGLAAVFDYKTGSAFSINSKSIYEGLHFQLPLYMLALNKMVKDIQPVFAGIYQVKDAENCKHIPVVADKTNWPYNTRSQRVHLPNRHIINENEVQLTLDELLDHSLDQAISRVEELKRGIFRHTRFPESSACQTYCPYRRICQKNVAKLKKMSLQDE